MLNFVFESVNMGLEHKFRALISVSFAVELEKDRYREFL